MNTSGSNYSRELEKRRKRTLVISGVGMAVLLLIAAGIMIVMTIRKPEVVEPITPVVPDLRQEEEEPYSGWANESMDEDEPELSDSLELENAQRLSEARRQAEEEARRQIENEKIQRAEEEARRRAEIATQKEAEQTETADAIAEEERLAQKRREQEKERLKRAEEERRRQQALAEKRKAEARRAQQAAEEKANKKAAPPQPPPPQQVAEKSPPAESSTKVFEAEDMPVPDKLEISEEAKVAMVQESRPGAEIKPEAEVNSNYKAGMSAYRSNDFRVAVQALSKVPKPSTRKRGVPEREEYVKANFYKGLSLQQLGRLKEAVSTYGEVLEYERYFPLVQMNLGICYVELRQYAKADRAFRAVVRDQNRIPPEQYDDVMQRSRYFWALAWTRLYQSANESDKKSYYHRQASRKWADYNAWFGDNDNYAKANTRADNYLKSLEIR